MPPIENEPELLVASRADERAFPGMSAQVAKQARALRNVMNGEALKAWIKGIADESLRGAASDRSVACEKWLSSVGKNWALKKGSVAPYEPAAEDGAGEPDWVIKAIGSGAPLHKLRLSMEERSLLSGILDWMKSSDGPALGSDWSKISVEQAERSEREWIEAKAKAALKKDLEAADAAGTELFAQSDAPGPEGRLGWRWVEVKSADALDREGALMRHCVGSYAADVTAERKSIYSLRDPDNKPRLTVEARGGELVQLKAFANASCPDDLRALVGEFAKAFEQRCESKGWAASVSEEVEQAGVISLPGYGIAIRGEPIPRGWESRLNAALDKELQQPFDKRGASSAFLTKLAPLGWVNLALRTIESANQDAKDDALIKSAGLGELEIFLALLPLTTNAARKEALKQAAKRGRLEVAKRLLPELDIQKTDSFSLSLAAYAGHVEMVKLLLSVFDPQSANSEALKYAAREGRKEVVELLLPLSNPLADDSRALREAAENGSADIVKLLLPVSEPTVRNSLALRLAAEKGHVEVVKLLLPSLRVERSGWAAMIGAINNGHLDVVKVILARLKEAPGGGGGDPLHFAALKGDMEIMGVLLASSIVPKAGGSEALRTAAYQGHVEVVKKLLPISDPLDSNSAALRFAAVNGHWAVVETLLPVSDATANDNQTLNNALKAGNDRMVEMIKAEIESQKAEREVLNIAQRLESRRGESREQEKFLSASERKISGASV